MLKHIFPAWWRGTVQGAPMTGIGFDRPLYILPFDHSGPAYARILDWKGALTQEQIAKITATKWMIYDAFLSAVSLGIPREKAGILVDQQFSGDIIRDATERGFSTCCALETADQKKFDLAFGQLKKDIEALHPTFWKVLVRYNPEAEEALNVRQTARLRTLSDYLHQSSRSSFMLELQVPPVKMQISRLEGNVRRYNAELRPQLTVQAIEKLQNMQIEPDVWQLEGLDHREDCASVVRAACTNGRERVGCVVVCSGEDDLQSRIWLRTAAAVPGFIGFAVGRTSLWSAILACSYAVLPQEEITAMIARRYREFVDSFEEKRQAAA